MGTRFRRAGKPVTRRHRIGCKVGLLEGNPHSEGSWLSSTLATRLGNRANPISRHQQKGRGSEADKFGQNDLWDPSGPSDGERRVHQTGGIASLIFYFKKDHGEKVKSCLKKKVQGLKKESI